MGAALTYARRYCLFSLVGIAGEDDIDAPDLPALIPNQGELARPAVNDERKRKSRFASAKPVLAIDASANRRNELLFEIETLSSMGQIDEWAVRGLPAKNTLHAGDALLIEDAFRKKIAELQPLPDRSSETLVPQVSSPSELALQKPLHCPHTTPRFRALCCHAQTAPTARQAPPRVCRGPALCCVRTPALRRPSSTLHTTQGTRSQSQR